MEVEEVAPTSISNLLNDSQFLAHVEAIRAIINPKN